MTLVSITASKSSSVRSSMAPRRLMPALLIRMSIGPKSRSTSAASWATSDADATSTLNAAVLQPVAVASAAADVLQASRVRLASATSAPASASARAIVMPRPMWPPVTRARRPFSENRSSADGGAAGACDIAPHSATSRGLPHARPVIDGMIRFFTICQSCGPGGGSTISAT